MKKTIIISVIAALAVSIVSSSLWAMDNGKDGQKGNNGFNFNFTFNFGGMEKPAPILGVVREVAARDSQLSNFTWGNRGPLTFTMPQLTPQEQLAKDLAKKEEQEIKELAALWAINEQVLEAIKKGDAEKLVELLESNQKYNVNRFCGEIDRSKFVSQQNKPIATILKTAGIDDKISHEQLLDKYPLLFAIKCGNTDIVQILLAHDAQLQQFLFDVKVDGITVRMHAWHYAYLFNSEDMVKLCAQKKNLECHDLIIFPEKGAATVRSRYLADIFEKRMAVKTHQVVQDHDFGNMPAPLKNLIAEYVVGAKPTK